MFSGDRIFPASAAVLLLLVAAIVVNVAFTVSISEKDPFERSEVQQFLTDLNDSETEAIGATASAIVVDGFLGPLAGVALFFLFRERHRLLATVALGFVLIASAVSLIADSVSVATLQIAKDFVDGGAADIAAGDSTTLEVGRAIAMVQFVLMQAGFSAISVALLALGSLISFAPERGVVPPRWLGWVLLLAGVAGLLTWGVAITDAAFVFFIVAGIGQIIGLAGLGIWLLRSQEEEGTMMAGAAALA